MILACCPERLDYYHITNSTKAGVHSLVVYCTMMYLMNDCAILNTSLYFHDTAY